MAQLMEVLKRFRPTKIAVESDAGSDRIPKRYADYIAGKYQLTANEIDQVGLRLAKELGHKTLYAVDADGDFPYPRLLNYAKGSGRSKELEAINSVFGDSVKAEGQYLASHTILQMLLYMNTTSGLRGMSGNTIGWRALASLTIGPAPTWYRIGFVATSASTATS
jgi:uncharacterized protein DUF5694